MNADLVNGLQNGLRPAILRKAINHVADGDRDAQRRQRFLGSRDLGGEGRGSEDAVEKRL